ncbi:MAG: hypothetical protein AMJ91_04135, partial [candidate division Zixibacteria bacterium SM23_73_3]
MKTVKLLTKLLLLSGIILCGFSVSPSGATMMREDERGKKEFLRSAKLTAELPNAQQRVHRVGLMHFCVTNWGFFGSQGRDLNESQGGCFNPNPDEDLPAPSCEYPPGSDLEYLFQGGLWIGALVDDHPYVTVACDGWQWIYEMWSDAGENGAIRERSIRPSAPCYSPDAISEQDIIAVYTDTSADIPLSPWKPEEVDWDGRKHFPLDLQVTQRSYSWSYEYAEDFVLIDLILKNIGVKKIREMYMGLYIDADCGHIDENPYGDYGAQDDICGFQHVITRP